jgi:hypothetical protein
MMNLVTPKAGAKHELLFNEPASASKVSLLIILSSTTECDQSNMCQL